MRSAHTEDGTVGPGTDPRGHGASPRAENPTLCPVSTVYMVFALPGVCMPQGTLSDGVSQASRV